MSINAAVDGLIRDQDRWVFRGWAYFGQNGERIPADKVEVEGSDAALVEASLRFELVIGSVEVATAVVFGSRAIVARKGDAEGVVRLTSQVKAHFLRALTDDVCAELDDQEQCMVAGSALEWVRRQQRPRRNGVQELLVSSDLIAYDESAVLGRDGYFFLYKGANVAHQLYSRNVDVAFVERWCELLDRRAALVRQRHAQYLQVVFPEKQSVLADAYPFDIPAATPMYAALKLRIAGNPWFVDVQQVLISRAQEHGFCSFRKTDTHLSTHGAMHAALALCAVICEGQYVDIGTPSFVEKVVGGDLGDKFGLGGFQERVLFPDLASWEFARLRPDVVSSVIPQAGHTGTTYSWRAAKPLFQKRVLIFGNSMFERGESPFGLSWWFSRIFSEVCFVWMAGFDEDLIETYKPDVVIGQTVERFLGGLPVR